MMARLQENPSWRPSTESRPVPVVSVTPGSPASGHVATGMQRTNSLEELQAVLDLSRRETDEENRLRLEEDEALRKVLELSLREQ